jgi:hypothetical protein
MKAILICGYRRHGKDFLFKQLSTPGSEPDILQKWQILQTPSSNKTFPIPSSKVHRLALADILKEEVHQDLAREGIIINDPEQQKDQIIYPDGRTLRDLYIARGLQRRAEEPDYWCCRALESVVVDQEITLCVTDIRFPNELEYFSKRCSDVTTVRVYRSVAPIPPSKEPSEHSLDYLLTDFVLCGPGDITKLRKVFPQYAQYQEIDPFSD